MAKKEEIFTEITPKNIEDREFNRKGFLSEGYKQTLSLVTLLFEKKIEKITGHNNKYVRPPGAIPESEFLQKCTKCGLCAEACPNKAIQIADGSEGLLNLGYPYLNVNQRPCVVCEGLPCIQACKDEAMIPIRPDEIFLGKVKIDVNQCNAFQGEECINCEYGCPIPGAIVFEDGKPIVQTQICIGCGVCVFACVEFPSAIHYVAKKDGFPSFRLRKKPFNKTRDKSE